MKTLDKSHTFISTILAFALIPLSGFATDIYLPSFPTMAKLLGTTQADIQLSLVVFIISGGIGQLFVGSVIDSFGRYRPVLISLSIFVISSLIIALASSITVVLAMRVVQGLAVALIVVSKRAFVMDVYTGEKLRHYTSLFSIIWATAPIVAPFLGGLLHHYFGWRSNFYFLGSATFIILLFELKYGGETLKESHSFNFKSLVRAYASKLATPDFAVSLVILGLAYSMVMMYNMASPFIIEQFFHQSAVVTGNLSLLSGVAILVGGLISKSMLNKQVVSKISVAGVLFLVLSFAMIGSMIYQPSLYAMAVIIFLLHVVSGFTFNTFYAFAFSRFSSNAGIVSGLIGGGLYVITSFISFGMANVLNIKTPVVLGVGYVIISVFVVGSFFLFMLMRQRVLSEDFDAVGAKVAA